MLPAARDRTVIPAKDAGAAGRLPRRHASGVRSLQGARDPLGSGVVRQIAVLKGHQGIVSSVAFAPDGATLASSALDKTFKLWDVAAILKR